MVHRKIFQSAEGLRFIVPIGTVGSSSSDLFVHRSAVEIAGLTTLSEGQVAENLVEYGRRAQAEIVTNTKPLRSVPSDARAAAQGQRRGISST
jgi:cold shock CspA family protein